jgi:hypothetical protein
MKEKKNNLNDKKGTREIESTLDNDRVTTEKKTHIQTQSSPKIGTHKILLPQNIICNFYVKSFFLQTFYHTFLIYFVACLYSFKHCLSVFLFHYLSTFVSFISLYERNVTSFFVVNVGYSSNIEIQKAWTPSTSTWLLKQNKSLLAIPSSFIYR